MPDRLATELMSAIFSRGTLVCRRAKQVQLPLPIERLRDVNFFSAAVSKMSPRWRSNVGDPSERQERSDSRLSS